MSALAAGTLPRPIRLGHAFPHPSESELGWVGWAYQFLQGKVELQPRAATDSTAVNQAEAWLDIDDSNRPVYAYAGCLHPALGRIGLVLSCDWLTRGLQGGSRCDSGGLAGRFGGFGCLPSDPAVCKATLQTLSFTHTHDWHAELHREVAAAYGAAVRSYVRGDLPTIAALDAHRQSFVQHALKLGLDDKRRVWTWEIRALTPARNTDVVAVALATEAFKIFDDLRRDFGDVDPRIRIIVGSAGPLAIDHFHEPDVIEALAGFL